MTNRIDLPPTLRRIGYGADDSAGTPVPPDDDLAGRRTASERYDAFVGAGAAASPSGDGGTVRPECTRKIDYDRFDYDGCGTEDLADPVLYLKQPGTPDEVSPSDIQQGAIGDHDGACA
jgi:hypothetical protein